MTTEREEQAGLLVLRNEEVYRHVNGISNFEGKPVMIRFDRMLVFLLPSSLLVSIVRS